MYIRTISPTCTSAKLPSMLVRAMTSLCKELGILVVAEGVETREERDMLETLGCDFMQGYLLAMPGRPFPDFVW